MPHDSFRFRQIHNRNQENEFLLKIRNIQSKDFGEYQCNVYANQTQTQKSSAINLTGTRCLKITEKVSFNFASEASNVQFLSGQKFMENAKILRSNSVTRHHFY